MLVSVIVPAYNDEEYLATAVNSCLRQTHRPLEVVVVNDGSTDGTGAVARRFGDAVRYLEQPNKGPSAARNRGLAFARGEYVAFLDADDAFSPTRVTVLLSALRTAPPNTAFATSDAWMWNGKRTMGRFLPPHRRGRQFTLLDVLEDPWCWIGMLARRDLLVRVGGFREHLRRAEDTDLWFRLLAGGGTYVCVGEPLYLYRSRQGSLSSDIPAQVRAACEVDEDALRRLPLSKIERRWLTHALWGDWAHVHAIEARHALGRGDRREWARCQRRRMGCQVRRLLLRPDASARRLWHLLRRPAQPVSPDPEEGQPWEGQAETSLPGGARRE